MKWLVAAAVILSVSGALAPLAAADHDSLHIVLLVEDRDYSIGSSCRVTVRAFERSDPTDVDNVPEVRVGAFASRTVLMQKVANGEYRGTFQIEQMDVLNNFLLIQASATKGRTSPDSTVYDASTGSTSIYVSSASGGSVQVLLYPVAVSTGVIGPGTVVTFRAETVLLGGPVEPSALSVSAWYYDRDGLRHEQTLAVANISSSVFEGNYTFPQVSYDIDATISASARYINDTSSRSLSLHSSVFFVLFHSLGRAANQSSFEFFVADGEGRPVAGATGDLTWWTDNQPLADRKRKDLGTTDVKGRLAGAVDYDNGTRLVHLQGYFNASGKSQSFAGVLEVPDAVGAFEPEGPDFQLTYAGIDRAYEPGKRLVREYAVFNNSTPMASTNIDVFVSASRLRTDGQLSMAADTMVYWGQVRTDARGRFNLSIDAPVNGSYLFLEFRTNTGLHPKQAEAGHYSTDGKYYSDASDIVVSADPFLGKGATVVASPLRLGEALDVKASMLAGAQARLAYACWIPGKFDPYTPAGTGSSDWQMWSAVMTYLNRSSGGFSGKVQIPSFMPRNIAYSMVVFALGRNSTLPYYGAAALKPSQGVNAAPPVPWLYIILAVAVIAAAAGGAAYAVRARRRRALAKPEALARPAPGQAAHGPAATVEKAVNCPDCGTPFIVRLGPAPTRIICPRCGKTGTHPAVAPGPAATPLPSAQYPEPATRYPESAVRTRTMACPRCKQLFTIERKEGPQQVTCPHCGKQGTIGKAAAPAAAPGAAPAAPAWPAPGPAQAPQTYSQPVRPPPAPVREPVTQYPAPGPRHPAPARFISCPYCRTRFPVEDPRRPLSVRCPGCGREGVLRK